MPRGKGQAPWDPSLCIAPVRSPVSPLPHTVPGYPQAPVGSGPSALGNASQVWTASSITLLTRAQRCRYPQVSGRLLVPQDTLPGGCREPVGPSARAQGVEDSVPLPPGINKAVPTWDCSSFPSQAPVGASRAPFCSRSAGPLVLSRNGPDTWPCRWPLVGGSEPQPAVKQLGRQRQP